MGMMIEAWKDAYAKMIYEQCRMDQGLFGIFYESLYPMSLKRRMIKTIFNMIL
jgi:hypothetical protein